MAVEVHELHNSAVLGIYQNVPKILNGAQSIGPAEPKTIPAHGDEVRVKRRIRNKRATEWRLNSGKRVHQ